MFKILLIVILFLLLIRMIFHGFLSYYSGYYEDRSDPRDKRKEGEVTIEKQPKLQKKISKDDGHYVDYEEVK